MSDADYWDSEARSDPRYAERIWGTIGDGSDSQEVTDGILDILDEGIPQAGGYVLEIGCGPARLLARLAARHRDVGFVGIDVSREMLALAEEVCGPMSNVGLLLGDETMLHDLSDASFDFVYCVELFQHLRAGQVGGIMHHVRRLLRPGGLFIAQHVVSDHPELAPHNYPRTPAHIASLYDDAANVMADATFAVHPAWLWVQARRP